jgi:flagellar secretion chaperone FliS
VIVARDPEAGRVLPRELRTREEKFVPVTEMRPADSEASVSRWLA